MVEIGKITVNVQRKIGTISPRLYGFNIEHILNRIIYGAIFDEGSPLSNKKGYRKDVVEAVSRLKPIIRWPGGCFASGPPELGYHWLDGVGPKEKRRMILDLARRFEESNRFGTDEFLEFCRLTNAEPFITVNAGSGTAEEAAHWIEYCNYPGNTYYANLRKENGHPEPYNVKYWSIGNEVWHLPPKEHGFKARMFAV